MHVYRRAYLSAVAMPSPGSLPGPALTLRDCRHGATDASCAFRAQERLHNPFHENDILHRDLFRNSALNCEPPYGIEP